VGTSRWPWTPGPAGPSAATAGTSHTSLRAAYRAGLLTNLANPKAAGFAISFLPQFVPPHAPVLATVLALASIQVLVSILWYTGVAWFVNQARRLFARDDVRRRMEQVSGLLLIGFGVRMAVQQR